jgi:2,3-bisphosphoglycerate-independent phosphoglycerate mutase
MNKKVILMILDGWGKSPEPKVSAIDNANIPFINSLYKNYPSAQLRTDGLNVGLPEGQMGNSEVGHMNLGAGRIVYQDLAKINLAVEHKTLSKEPVLVDAFQYAKDNNVKVHLLGLVSDGGVHSHTSHLRGLIDATQDFGLKKVFIHAFTDGRDVDPKSGISYIQNLENYISNTTVKLASVVGRYYAMDRDKRWERVKLAYDLLVNGIGTKSQNIGQTIVENYNKDITDEFIAPTVAVDDNDSPVALIHENDVVIFFNFRTDRGRELTEVLSQRDFHEQNMHKINLYYVTLTNYDESYQNVKVVYNKDNITETLGEILEKNHKKQIRIAETEKYPHVTFFFSGGRELPFAGETRILKNSPKVATYDLQPEMSAFELADALVPELEKGEVDFVCLNFANGDMVGHTGVMSAAIKACEAVDKCVEKVITSALKNDYTTLVIADHGNCETMINPDGSPNTAHTTNPVPIILVDKDLKKINDGVLADLAPTILELMGVEKPEVMTRHSLL